MGIIYSGRELMIDNIAKSASKLLGFFIIIVGAVYLFLHNTDGAVQLYTRSMLVSATLIGGKTYIDASVKKALSKDK